MKQIKIDLRSPEFRVYKWDVDSLVLLTTFDKLNIGDEVEITQAGGAFSGKVISIEEDVFKNLTYKSIIGFTDIRLESIKFKYNLDDNDSIKFYTIKISEQDEEEDSILFEKTSHNKESFRDVDYD